MEIMIIPSLLFIGVLQITSYRPTPEQTRPECKDNRDCYTAAQDVPTKYGIAVSQDLLKEYHIEYGDVLCVEKYGCRVINDTMNVRHKKAADLMVWSWKEEHNVGTRHLKAWLIRTGEN